MTRPALHSLDKRLLINVLLLLLLFFVLLNFYFVYQIRGKFQGAQTPAAIPNVQITILTVPECPDCFDIEAVIRAVRQERVNITSEERIAWNAGKAQNLVTSFQISHAPALIIQGETDNLFLPLVLPRQHALVFDNPTPPYLDISSGAIAGRATITVITAKTCTSCFNITTALDQIRGVVSIASTTMLDAKDPQAAGIMARYNITRVPSLILSKDAELYPVVNRSWQGLGTREADGSLVLRATPPPYLDLATGKVRGLVDITYLYDSSCKPCYNASLHKDVLSQVGVAFGKESWVEIHSREGKEFRERFNITAVPTILLNNEAASYPLLGQIWSQVGTVEQDGTHVFRNLQALGPVTWMDLAAGRVRSPSAVAANLTGNTTAVAP